MKLVNNINTLCLCLFFNKILASCIQCDHKETAYKAASQNTLRKYGLQGTQDERLLAKREFSKDKTFAYDVGYAVTAPPKKEAPGPDGKPQVSNLLNQTQLRDTNLKEARSLLKNFSKRLKSFIFKGAFDVINFEYETDELSTSLVEIKNLTEISGPDEQDLRQLRFVTHMFQVMSGSVAELKSYLTSEIPGHALVYRIIEMNVILLAMHDTFGNLDRSIRWYEARLFQFWRNTLVWGRSVSFLVGMPAEYRAVYDQESMKAMKTISDLGGQFAAVEVVGF